MRNPMTTARRLRGATLAVIGAALLALAGCAVEWQNLQPARELAQQRQSGELYTGWRLYQERCARCHSGDAAGSADAPDLLVRLRALGPRAFASLVLTRYDWALPGMPPSSDRAAREAWLDRVMDGRAGALTMPAWQNEPEVQAHVKDLYTYLAARSEGTQGPGRPAP